MVFGLYELARSFGAPSVRSLPTWGLVLASVGGLLLAPLFATLLISSAEALLNVALSLIEKLDAHTGTGGVGILGVLLLVVGFALQVGAMWS